MSTVDDMFDNVQSTARVANFAAQDTNPDEAARALELSHASGAPAEAIYDNIEGFERQHKASLGSALISNNGYLADYIGFDPMAARLSHDDLGQLDTASQAISNLHPKSFLERIHNALSLGLPEKAFPGDPLQPYREAYSTRPTDVEYALRHPAAYPIMKGLENLVSTPFVVGSQLISGLSNVVNEFGGRDLAAMLENEVMKPEGGQLGKYLEHTRLPEMGSALQTVAPFAKVGKEPPPGVHPLLDEVKVEQAKQDGDAIKEALSESAKSATRERSPDYYANFVRQHVGEREIGIDAEAVRKLYGDKIPEVGDNLLGWVPDLQTKLASAESIGGDIRVSLADWLARVEPDVAKELHDSIRVRDGGLTLEEAKGLEPKEVIADPLQLVRGAGGFEPQFSLGDRKVTLQRMGEQETKGPFGKEQGFHDFDLLDETGKKIGYMNLSEAKGGKQIYVEMIQAGKTDKMYDPNFLGPAIIRDLRRQIKAEFPNAETITGHRVSGAREKAGVEMTAAMPVIKLSQEGEGWGHVDSGPTLRELFQEIGGQTIDQQYSAFHYGPELEQYKVELDRAIRDELARITPKQAQIFTPDQISAIPERPGFTRRGFHQQFKEQDPWIVVALDSPNAMGVARHEAVHHLRQQGFFTEAEWSTLERASRQNDWATKFEINKRYAHLPESAKLEESIAEAYRTWKDATDKKAYPPGINAIFQKLQEFFEALRLKVREITGKDLSWDEVFQKVDVGEVGSREGNAPLKEGAFQASDEPIEGIFEKAKAMGVTEAHMNRMLNHIQKRNAEDLEKAQARAEKQQKRSQTAEWKQRRTDIRDEVREQLSSRPDLATDELFAKQKIKLNPDYLSEDQKASLPKDYIQKKDGVNPDDLAPYFGYTSGDALVERLGMLTTDRKSAGMSQRDYFNRLVGVETDRRLNAEFGDLSQNIMDAAKDQALSETQLDLVHEETLAYALAAGTEPKFTKEQVREMVKGQFDLTPVRDISSDRLIQTAGKLGRKIEEAGSKGDWAEAYRISQQREFATIAAKLARDYEKAQASLDRIAKTFRKREVPSVAQEYTNWVHDLLVRAGYPVNRSIQDLAENIGRQSERTLQEFVQAKRTEWMGLRDLPVADAFLDLAFKEELKNLPHKDFREFKNAIDVLVKAGRDEKKIYREGEAADRTHVLQEMLGKLETFPLKEYPVTKGAVRKALEIPKAWLAGMTNIETLLNRWDRADPRGVFNQYINYPLAKASNQKNVLEREAARNLEKLGPLKDRDKLVDSPFADPLLRTSTNPDGLPFTGFTRANVMAMIHNAGNKSNWTVLARGYGMEPEALMKWLHRNSDKEMWDRAQKMGDLFKGLAAKADGVYERITGANVEKIQLEPIQTPFGTYAGWYHPLIRDPLRQEIWQQDQAGQWTRIPAGRKISVYDDLDNLHISTANGYTKRRTGAIYPLDLSIDSIPSRLKQIIHDVAFRETILETDKIFSNKAFRAEVIKRYGAHYEDLLGPYLKHLAGAESIASQGAAKAHQLSEFLRQNVISTYIGFNPYTALKHGPTAWVMSMGEVGGKSFLNAVTTLYGKSPELGLKNSEFAMKWSEELQRRERHWQDTIAGEHASLEGSANLRQKIVEKGSWLVAQSDMLSAKPTWVAAYNNSIEKNLSHGEAIDLADRAVRRAHGSTAATNQPALVRGGGPLHGWLTSVYGFFGTAMQRRIEIAHQLNDAYHLVGEGEINKAARTTPGIAADVFTYVIWPTIVEEWVTGLTTDDRRGWGTHLVQGAFMGLSSSVLYLRDLMHAFVTGQDPGVGLLSSPLHDMNKVLRDFKHGREAMNKAHAGKTVADTLTVLGEATGMVPKTIANATRFGIDLVNHQAYPKSVPDVLRGVTRGTTKLRVEK